MSAPIRKICLQFTNILKTNSGFIPKFPNIPLCRRCEIINDVTAVNWSYSCLVLVPKNSTYQIRTSRGQSNVFGVQKRTFLYDALHQTKRDSCIGLLNVLPHGNYRFYSGEGSSSKDQPLEKKQKENIYTVPNLLTVSRIVLTPAIGYLITQESFSLALGLFVYAGLTDLLDGYIARNFKNQMSTLGTALDPLADKLMIIVLTGTLTIANLLPVPLAALIIGRDAVLIVIGFVIRYVSLPPPITLKRYFDVTYPTAKILPSRLSKWNTASQILLVMMTLAAPVFNFVDHPVLQGLWYVTAATTFGSGVDYIINWKRSIKFLKKK